MTIREDLVNLHRTTGAQDLRTATIVFFCFEINVNSWRDYSSGWAETAWPNHRGEIINTSGTCHASTDEQLHKAFSGDVTCVLLVDALMYISVLPSVLSRRHTLKSSTWQCLSHYNLNTFTVTTSLILFHLGVTVLQNPTFQPSSRTLNAFTIAMPRSGTAFGRL